eukprot:g8819.t1
MSMKAWHSHFDALEELKRRKQSPECTEAMMKTFRCMKKSHRDRSECQELLDAVHRCHHPDMSKLERKPTAASTTAATTA